MPTIRAIFWGFTLGDLPSVEILFPKGEEDMDHMVARVPLLQPVTSPADGWRAARHLLDTATIEQLAEIRSSAMPVDRRVPRAPKH